ncbi:DUF6804 family protein [Magnetospirillum sulfuroxidans]|uniref:Uncharacterized protein n=1 Tax=Magnetospirillum sulfuroxidans TaxID=611300 RepID=A0ABS5IFM8_9PROT|nr:DUF6804 family protein [Magnetospirillum sulfuroxidans]MBR9973066.1 hypothetical protein [Magnetospirillum sulfuroxidans]
MAALMVAAIPLPYGAYTIIRAIVFVVSIIIVVHERKAAGRMYAWSYGFLLMAILFNPILPVHLGRGFWFVIDVGAAMVFFAHYRRRCAAATEGRS